MDDLLGRDFSLGEKNARDRCLDQLLAHQPALFSHLQARWRDRFGARLEVLPGHTSDKTTRREFPRKIQAPYGKADRIWIMDRGIPTEEVLAEMRASTPPVCDLVGTPRGRRGQLEAALLERPWPQGREGVEAATARQETPGARTPVQAWRGARALARRLAAHRPRTASGAIPGRRPFFLSPEPAGRHPNARCPLPGHRRPHPGRTLVLPRSTQPQADQRILIERLGLELPPQPPPRISAGGRLSD